MTPKQRQQIYELALSRRMYSGKGQYTGPLAYSEHGICAALVLAAEDLGIEIEQMEEFVELFGLRPKGTHFGQIWFPLKTAGAARRKALLEQCIVKCGGTEEKKPNRKSTIN